MIKKAYLSIGTNIGDRINNINEVIFKININKKLKITNLSAIYETEPYGEVIQDNFLNIIVEVETAMTARELLNLCLSFEDEMGRTRTVKWGERIIDVDIILYEDKILDTDDLCLPHPYAYDRQFVLLPLLEINPKLSLKQLYNESISKKTSSYDLAKRSLDCTLEEWVMKLPKIKIKKLKNLIAKMNFFQTDNFLEVKFASIIAKNIANEYILVKHRDRDYFELPGGKCDSINYIDEAKRELWEETGTEKFDIKYYMTYYIDLDGLSNYTHIYAATLYDYKVNEKFEMAEVKGFKDVPKKLNYEMHRYVIFAKENCDFTKEDFKIMFYW